MRGSEFIYEISLVLIILIVVTLISITVSESSKKSITESCELSGSFVVNGKTYKCELIK